MTLDLHERTQSDTTIELMQRAGMSVADFEELADAVLLERIRENIKYLFSNPRAITEIRSYLLAGVAVGAPQEQEHLTITQVLDHLEQECNDDADLPSDPDSSPSVPRGVAAGGRRRGRRKG